MNDIIAGQAAELESVPKVQALSITQVMTILRC